jgi:hypothetical protein
MYFSILLNTRPVGSKKRQAGLFCRAIILIDGSIRADGESTPVILLLDASKLAFRHLELKDQQNRNET